MAGAETGRRAAHGCSVPDSRTATPATRPWAGAKNQGELPPRLIDARDAAEADESCGTTEQATAASQQSPAAARAQTGGECPIQLLRADSTQNSLPSGSARTTHADEPCPTSALLAPARRKRSTSA